MRSSLCCRRAAAALLLASALTLSTAAPSQAAVRRGDAEGPWTAVHEAGFLRILLHLFGFAGGTMDPNGHH